MSIEFTCNVYAYLLVTLLCFNSSVLQADKESKTGMAEDCDKELDETVKNTL